MKRSILSVLFALLLLVGLLAVSVSATEDTGTTETHTDHCVCGGHGEGKGDHACETLTWQAWTDGDDLPTTSGNYYLTVDVTLSATKTIAAGDTVNLCLNGHTVTSNATRVYSVKGSWNLTDCGAQSEWGTISAHLNSTYGGIAYVYEAASSVGIYGGKLSSTGTYVWGSLVIVQNGTLELYDGDLQGGNCIRKHVTSSNDDRDGRGASVYMMAGTFNMYGGTISGGTVQNSGGNVMITGANTKFNMYGGTITGGTVDPDLGTMMDGATPRGGNVYLMAGTTTITGGTITGGTAALGRDVYVAYGVKGVTVSGEVTIGDVYVADNASFTIDALKDSVGISNSHTAHCICGGKAVGMTNHSCAAEEEWIPWGYLSAERGKMPTASGNYYLVRNVSFTATKDAPVAGATVNLCLNGRQITLSKGGRLNVKGTLNLTRCGEEGKIVSTSTSKYGGIFYQYDGSKVTIFDGTYDASGTGVRNGGVAHVGNASAAYMDIYGGSFIGGTLTVPETTTEDDKPRGTKGGILDITVKSVVNMYGGTLEGGSAEVTSDTTDAKNRPMGGCIAVYDGTFNMYDGSVSGGRAEYGGCIYVRTGGLNIYGGTVSEGHANLQGGNIYTVVGGNISGGTVTQGKTDETTGAAGGNIRSSGGTLTISGTAMISKGNAKSIGGNIHAFKLVVTGGTITEGYSGSQGGNIYLGNASSAQISGGTISDGSGTTGGNIAMYAETGDTTLTISGGTISGGTSRTGGGGNIFMFPKADGEKHAILTVTGGEILGGTGKYGSNGGSIRAHTNTCEVIVGTEGAETGPVIAGGYADSAYGGNVYVEGGSFTMYSGTITNGLDGAANAQRGGAAYIKGGTFAMHGGTIDGCISNGDGGNVFTLNSNVTMTGGTVKDGYAIKGGGGNFYVNVDNETEVTMQILGGTITGGTTGIDGTTTKSGGNLRANNAYVTLIIGAEGTEGPTVSGGVATANGGNLYSAANPATIYSGTFTHGLEEGVANAEKGGGIYIASGALDFRGGTVDGCISSATGGGGIYVNSGKFTMSGGTVQNCSASAGGGGVFVASAGTFTMTGGTVQNCQALYGGNLFVYGTTADISGGTISGGISTNQDSSAGGNINVEKKDDTYVGTLNLSGTAVITGGQATNSDGGNIFINQATMTMTGGTISGGLAEGEKNAKHGGAICVADGSLNISGGTISGCVSSGHGGGIYATENAAVTISGGTFTGNQSTGSGSNGGNLSAEGAVTISGGTFENGSAVNAGGNVSARNATVTGGTFLGGSAKYGGNAAFISGGDSTIENASFTGGEAQLGGAVYVTNNSISLNNVTISGGKANKTKTSSNGGNFYTKANPTTLTNCTVSDGTATYRGGNIYASSGITITGGSITGGIAKVGEGEKIATNGGNLTVFGGGTFSGVTISDGQGTHGGNIAINDGTYTIENCTISNGNATLKCDGTTNGNGGNLYAIGNSIVTVTGCNFSGGQAQRAGSIAAWGKVTIDNTVVDGGHAYFAGGNVMAFGENSSLTLNAGTVLKNGSVTLKGAALYLSDGKHVHTINDGVEIYAGEAGEVAPCVYVDDVQVKLVGAPSMDSIHVAEGIKNYGLIADQLAEEARITLTATTPGMFGCGVEADLTHFVSPQGYILACRNGKLYLDAPTAVYVSDNGSDSNTGSLEAPYKTLNHALSMLADEGTVYIKDILTQTTSGTGTGGWAEHGKTFTLTGGEFVTSTERIYLRDNVTFDNLILTMPLSTNSASSNYGSFFFYCNGFTTVFEEDVTVRYLFNGTYMSDSYQSLTYTPSGGTETAVTGSSKLYGGANSAYGVIESTDLTVLSGVWGEIYGGSNDQNLTGDVHLTVGGKVNEGVDYVSHTHSGRHVIFGGSRSADIAGTVYMNVIGGQNHTSTFGGSSGTCSIGAVELHATGGNGMAIYGGGKYGVNTVGTINFYYEGATFEQVFGGSISQDLIVTDALNIYVTGGTITRRLYGGTWVNREESLTGDWDPQKKVTGIINLYIGENANITCNLNKPSGESYNDQSIYAHSRYPSNASEEQARLIFQSKAAYDKYKGMLKANDLAMSVLMSGMTAADYICYMGTTVDGNTITAGANEVEDNVSNALDLPSVTATLNLEDSYAYKGQTVEPAYTLSGETTLPFSVSYANNTKPGTGTVTMTLNGQTVTADFTITDGKVATVNGTVYYYLQEALDAAGDMGLVVLAGNTDESAEIKTNLYLDLNGYSIAGTLTVAEGMTLYGVDTSTNDYDCSDGYGTIAKVNGTVALHHKTENTGALGRILRYLTHTDPETGAVSFHRIYLGIIKVTIRPGKNGVGYKAIFGGDEIVKSMLDEKNAFGYRLQLDGQETVVSRDGTREEFITGGEGTNVGLVVSNYDMEYADKKLTAWVTLTLADGTEITTDNEVITSSQYEFTFKNILKQVDKQIDLYSQEQLEGLKNMISSIADQLQEWEFTNLYKLVTTSTETATPAPSKEEI